MRARFARQSALFERHRQIEMGIRVGRVQPQRVAVADLRFDVTSEVVKDVAQVEVRLEHIGLEGDCAFVERLRLGNLVARVVNVRQVDDRGNEVRVNFERTPVCPGSIVELAGVPAVEACTGQKILFCIGRRPTWRRNRLHESDERRWLAPPELQHFCGLGFNAKVQAQLPRPGREQIAQHRPELSAVPQRFVGLPNRGQISKGEELCSVGAAFGPDEPPLLHVTQMILAHVRAAIDQLPAGSEDGTRGRHAAFTIIYGTSVRNDSERRGSVPAIVLAGDVGGTKTLVGLFDCTDRRPQPLGVFTYRTTAFNSFTDILRMFARDVGRPLAIDAVSVGVAGPVVGDRARLTNIEWDVSAHEIAEFTNARRVRLINDLEAMAGSAELLTADEILLLQPGVARSDGNAAVIAAGTGLGQAYLHRIAGRLRPFPSEAGHADFAPRTDREIELLRMLRAEYGRVEVEHVLSGPGLVNLHRFTHGGNVCPEVSESAPEGRAAAISESAIAARCPSCADALSMFVSVYGAEAGNLALRGVASSGLYVGGGIAPKILPALRRPTFIEAFRAKGDMSQFLAQVPVKVILNPEAGLLGAAAQAQELLAG